jgi:DNA-directed RNA polymerase subunit E'
MFKQVHIHDMVRVPPEQFGDDIDLAIIASIKQKYEGWISRDLGIVIDVIEVTDRGDGIVVPGDGAAYYELTFSLLVFKPEIQEIVYARVRDIADFGAFLDMGAIDGMIHIGQTMDDFVTYSKEKVLTGKNTNRVLRVGDNVRARIVALSYKDLTNPRIGLTMRQSGLGRLEWVEEDLKEKK